MALEDNEGYVTDDKPALLMTASNEYEAVGIEALLRSFGIPTLLKHRGTEGFTSMFTGTSTLGVDIFVPSKLVDKANEIIDAEPDLDEEIESGGQEATKDPKGLKRLKGLKGLGNKKEAPESEKDEGVLTKPLSLALVLAAAVLLLCLYLYYGV